MSAVREDVMSCLSEHAWKQLSELEALHRSIQRRHESVIRSLDEAALCTSADRRELQIAWNQYRAVVADLCNVTENIESLRLTLG